LNRNKPSGGVERGLFAVDGGGSELDLIAA